MSHSRRAITALHLLVATVAALGVVVSAPNPAGAECDGPIPAFRKALSTAQRVIVADVVAIHGPEALIAPPDGDGRSGELTLQVIEVLRGAADPLINLRDLPTQPCSSTVRAAVGDRIVLALGALDYEPPIRVNTVAWVDGRPPDWSDVETITLEELRGRLGVEAPVPSPAAGAAAPETSRIPVIVTALTAVIAVGVILLVLGRRHAPPG